MENDIFNFVDLPENAEILMPLGSWICRLVIDGYGIPECDIYFRFNPEILN